MFLLGKERDLETLHDELLVSVNEKEKPMP
jgi:hypothetical protein